MCLVLFSPALPYYRIRPLRLPCRPHLHPRPIHLCPLRDVCVYLSSRLLFFLILLFVLFILLVFLAILIFILLFIFVLWFACFSSYRLLLYLILVIVLSILLLLSLAIHMFVLSRSSSSPVATPLSSSFSCSSSLSRRWLGVLWLPSRYKRSWLLSGPITWSCPRCISCDL